MSPAEMIPSVLLSWLTAWAGIDVILVHYVYAPEMLVLFSRWGTVDVRRVNSKTALVAVGNGAAADGVILFLSKKNAKFLPKIENTKLRFMSIF